MRENDVHFGRIFTISVAESLIEMRLFMSGAIQRMSLECGGELRAFLDGAAEVLLHLSILDPFCRVQLCRYDMPLAFPIQLAVRFNVQHGGNQNSNNTSLHSLSSAQSMEYSDEEEPTHENALLTFMRSHPQLTVRMAIAAFMQQIKQRVGEQFEEKTKMLRGGGELRRGMAGR